MSFMIVPKWLSEKESDPFDLAGHGQTPFRIVRMIFRAAAIMLVVAAMGCGSVVVDDDVADDEAMKRAIVEGKPAAQAAKEYFYPAKIVDYFDGMDSQSPQTQSTRPHQLLGSDLNDEVTEQVALSTPQPAVLGKSEHLGRNTWMIWCGGNEGFWDDLTQTDLGFIDLLKVVDSRQRSTRFRDAGLINDPEGNSGESAGESEFRSGARPVESVDQ